MCELTISAVRQHLAPRGIKAWRCEPDHDGNTVYRASKVVAGKLRSVTALDPHFLYIRALKHL